MYNHIIIIFKIKKNIVINLIKDSISVHHYTLKNNKLLSFEEEEEEEEEKLIYQFKKNKLKFIVETIIKKLKQFNFYLLTSTNFGIFIFFNLNFKNVFQYWLNL